MSLLLFLPWFLLLGSLYWLFPRQPRTRRRRLFDGTTLLLAFALSIASMLWGIASAWHSLVPAPSGRRYWRCFTPTARSAVLVLALLLRPRWLDR